MITAVSKKILNSKKGQAIVEFLIFLPFMLMMYSVVVSISNAINASINQQKIARSYFYYRAAGNSTMPYPIRRGAEPSDAFRFFGLQIMGWATRLEGGRVPVAPCYKFNLLLGEDDDDTCEEPYSERTTQFIRVITVYGVCGAFYQKNGIYPERYPLTLGQGGIEQCVNQN